LTREYVRIKVISPSELEPASEKPNGVGTVEYLFTKSSDRRNEKTLSDIYYLPFIAKLYEYFIDYEVVLVYHRIIKTKYAQHKFIFIIIKVVL
jgi:hypothetical protein